MRTFLINQQQLESILQYLGNRPFVEVAGMIQMIGNLPAMPDVPATPPQKAEEGGPTDAPEGGNGVQKRKGKRKPKPEVVK